MSNTLFQSQLIRAGAGSGKTEALVNEVYKQFKDYKINQDRNPRFIVCTFTKAASQELKERLFKKALEDYNKGSVDFLTYVQSSCLHISTIHSILNLFLKRYGMSIDLNPDFKINTFQNRNEKLFDSLAESFLFREPDSLLKQLPYFYLKELFLFYFNCRLKYGKNFSFLNEKDFENSQKDKTAFESVPKQSDFKDFENVGFNYKWFKELSFNLENLKNFKSLFKEEESFDSKYYIPLLKEFEKKAEEFFPLFFEMKKKSGFLDQEDLLLFSLFLIRSKPQVAKQFSSDWDYWFVDEYQDTSFEQEQILFHMTKFKNVFCVGDPGQSIYMFRSANPDVFKRRERAMGENVVKLDKNYRSSPELVHFYNDFFSEKEGFIKSEPHPERFFNQDKPCVQFFTYQKEPNRKYSDKTLKAVQVYIEKLKLEGASYGDIVILSSKNEDLIEIAGFLREQNLPLTLYSSKNFTERRLLRDALFLLKFFINPFDNTNLKALLRTPYFDLSDQELADSSFDHNQNLKNKKKPLAFWFVIENTYSHKMGIKILKTCLEDQKQKGTLKAFEKAVMDLGLMPLSYLTDSTKSSEHNLWKLFHLLNKSPLSPLELFYLFLNEKEESVEEKEAPISEANKALQLMTVHKSKGLEFKHVILIDASLNSSLKKHGFSKKQMIYDETNHKMSFAVPIGGREKKKVASYAQKIYQEKMFLQGLKEKNRLFYVAMTRAKKSLLFFIPEAYPEVNSWLEGVSFFKNRDFKNKEKGLPLLEQNSELKTWKLNQGIYKAKNYLFQVQSVETVCQALSPFLKTKNLFHDMQKNLLFTGNKKYFKPRVLNWIQSKNFTQNSQTKENIKFSVFDKKNMFFKTQLGIYLHFFLQKLSFLPLDGVLFMIEKSFFSQKDKKKLKEALAYVYHLEEPFMKFFLEKGFSEWSFRLKKKNLFFKGRIDLWSWKGEDLHVFDYKSSDFQLESTKKQLIFYAWILSQIYQAQSVYLYAMSPFQKKLFLSFKYGDREKNIFEKEIQKQEHRKGV